MRRLKYLILGVIFAIFVAAPSFGQDKTTEGQPEPERRIDRNQPMDARARMLRQLGLSREQIQRLMRVNRERKPIMEAAQARLKQATTALDDAIYADELIEDNVQARLKDTQLAQAEVLRIRFMNEVAVRRLLTPEQLLRFRILRQRFEQMKERNVGGRAAAPAIVSNPKAGTDGGMDKPIK